MQGYPINDGGDSKTCKASVARLQDELLRLAKKYHARLNTNGSLVRHRDWAHENMCGTPLVVASEVAQEGVVVIPGVVVVPGAVVVPGVVVVVVMGGGPVL